MENSIGLDRITYKKLPLEAEVKEGETTEIDLRVTTCCKVSGSVAISALNKSAYFHDSRNTIKGGSQSFFLTGSGERDVYVNHDGKSNDIHDEDREGQKGLANILVELKNAEEVIQQVSGEQGSFLFPYIRPGKWTVRIYENNLPAHHYVEKKEFSIDLKPGEERQITAKVLPTQRPIQIIDEGVIN